MLSNLEEFWARVRSSPWWTDLSRWLDEHPIAYSIAGALLLLVIIFLIRRFGPRSSQDSVTRQLLREVRQLKREGDYLGVGQRYESLGLAKRALEAYRRGGLYAEYAELLVRLGKKDDARIAAREGEVWVLYGDLCRDDEDFEEAAVAYENAGKLYDAARAWQAAGRPLKAARAYVAVGVPYNGVKLLMAEEGEAIAEALETAVRASLHQARGSAMSPDMAKAVRRTAQLWLSEGEARRAYQIALDSEQWDVAVPIARDYLDPDPSMVEVCLRAGAYLAAAEISKALGETCDEARYRGEHFERHENPAEAARWFEKAEAWSEAADQWAAAGELERSAELYARIEEFEQAAQIYAALGDEAKKEAMREAGRAHDPRSVLESEDKTRRVRPAAHLGEPAEERPENPIFAPASAVPPAPAQQRYAIDKEIGRGGMGVVYRARDTVLERTVAYKLLSADLSEAEGAPSELLKEAQAAARLSHPNIVQVYDAGRLASGFFVVMEYVDGENFAELLKRRKLSISGTITVGRQVCAALEHAHGRGIVHRDLKPSNLMWTAENQVKLTDFGLARILESGMGQVLTRPAGTPFYMAPEQIRGDPVDIRTDLYSLGCVLFEMLCSRTPFSGSGSSIYHHLNSRPEDPRLSRREIPQALSEIILRCLSKDPEKRPRRAAEVDRDLAALLAR